MRVRSNTNARAVACSEVNLRSSDRLRCSDFKNLSNLRFKCNVPQSTSYVSFGVSGKCYVRSSVPTSDTPLRVFGFA